jgi:Family of unknown function (DUF6353)
MTQPLWLRKTGHTINQNSTTILSGIAIAGVVTTAVLTAKAAVKAKRSIAAKEIKEEVTLTPKEQIQETWTVFIPPAITGAATIACIVGANQIGLRRNAALAGAYAIAETAFREYREEVVKQLGAAKERGVTDEVAQKQVNDHPVADAQVVFSGGGDVLCYDRYTDRYFRSDHEAIRRAENDFNANILGGDMYGSLNDFYALLGLGPCTAGDVVGFSCDNLLKLVFTSVLEPDTGKPCLAIGFQSLPRADYSSL